MRIRCSWCGKPVSTEVPDGTIVRAFVECPECIATLRWQLNETLSALAGEHGIDDGVRHEDPCEVCVIWTEGVRVLKGGDAEA